MNKEKYKLARIKLVNPSVTIMRLATQILSNKRVFFNGKYQKIVVALFSPTLVEYIQNENQGY